MGVHNVANKVKLEIQTLLGHASISMTMDVYGHLFENAEEDVAMFEKLESDLLTA